MTDEFLRIWRALMTGETVSRQGPYLTIDGGQLFFPPVQQPRRSGSRLVRDARNRDRGRADRHLP